MDWKSKLSAVWKGLGALIGVLIAGGLLTIQWEGYQRDADLKGKLVSEVSSSVARASMSARFLATGAYAVEQPDVALRRSRIQEKYNEGKRRWEEDAVYLRAQLQAYYKDASLAQAWEKYANTVSKFYQLSYPVPSGDATYTQRHLGIRAGWADSVKAYLGGSHQEDDYWGYLISRKDEQDEYSTAYIDLSTKILKRQESINKQILRSRTIYTPLFLRILPD
jgi:hypothetical protein